MELQHSHQDAALMKHVHEASSLPANEIPTAYCCFLATNMDHQAQEGGLQLFYNGQIAINKLPRLGDTLINVQLQKANHKLHS
jgi:hypothetical protein